MMDLITRKARLKGVFEQNYFTAGKVVIINPLSPRPHYLSGKPWSRQELCACVLWIAGIYLFLIGLHWKHCLPVKEAGFSVTLDFHLNLCICDQAETNQSNRVQGLHSRHSSNESKGLKSSYIAISFFNTQARSSRFNCNRRTYLFYLRNRHFTEALY